VELRRFELLTSSMRTRNNGGSPSLTKAAPAPRLRGTSIISTHAGSHDDHAGSRSKCYAKCFFGANPKTRTRQRSSRIETCVNTSEETEQGVLGLPTRLMTRAEAATYLRRSTGTLANWAAQRKGPVYYRQEDGAVVYAVEDLGDWLSAQRVLPRAA
jgi:hypothetical protein